MGRGWAQGSDGTRFRGSLEGPEKVYGDFWALPESLSVCPLPSHILEDHCALRKEEERPLGWPVSRSTEVYSSRGAAGPSAVPCPFLARGSSGPSPGHGLLTAAAGCGSEAEAPPVPGTVATEGQVLV